MDNSFYTYAYLREDGTPYYIGKGKGRRAWENKHRKGAPTPKDKSKILILKKNLTNEQAIKHEIYMIAVFGRKDIGTGILWNFTDGGDGVVGRVASEETRKRLSEGVKRSVEDGTHSGFIPEVTQEASRRLSVSNKRLAEEGKHPAQSPENRKAAADRLREMSKQMVRENTHPSQNPENLEKLRRRNQGKLESGTHPFQTIDREWLSEKVREKLKGAKRWVNREGERKFQREKPEGEWQNGVKWKEGKEPQ
jgi:hypothetical protein